MPVSMLPQAPHRQDRKIFLTPLIGDVLFSEVRDCNRILIPEYGTPHPDTVKWPNHKLVYVKPVDIERNEIFEFFYAADRENQDEYNFEFGSTQIGGILVDTVTRTYVTLRTEFDPNAPELITGSSMPNVPVDKFTGSWILYEVDQKRIGQQELDSLFVAEQRLYIQSTTGFGATYGEIVTTSDSVVAVVDEGTDVDTGIDIISSQITPLGNGKAFKVTKEVLGGWPDPVEESFSIPTEGLPPAIFRDNLEVTTVTRKVGVIPENIILTGNEIGKAYKRETPDRVEEEVTTMDFDISADLLEESVNRTAYLITRSESVASATGELPEIGDGSYTLIYRAGELTIYRNSVTTTEGVAGLKGIDTSSQAWGSIEETTNYTLQPEFTQGGSTRLIFKDSMTQVFESTTVDVTTDGTTKEIDSQTWGTITWDGTYDKETSGDRSRQVWSNGAINVYLNENATLDFNTGLLEKSVNRTAYLITRSESVANDSGELPEVGDGSFSVIYRAGKLVIYRNTVTTTEGVGGYKGTDTNAQEWGSIIEETNYTPEPIVKAGGSTRLIFKDSMTQMYESTSVTVSVTGSTKNVDPQLWGRLIWNGVYEKTSSGSKSRQVWSNGDTNVFLNETAEFDIDGDEFLSKRKTTPIFFLEEYTSYSTEFVREGQNISSTIVYNIDGQRIYENTRAVITASGYTRKYPAVINFSVPSVFLGVEATSFPRRDGGEETYFTAKIREGFSGPMPCTVSEYFTKEPSPPEKLLLFKPKPISFVTPFGSLSVPPTLHGQFSIPWNTSTFDPIYKFQNDTIEISPTEPPDYLGQTFTVSYDSTVYEDGYIVREYSITL